MTALVEEEEVKFRVLSGTIESLVGIRTILREVIDRVLIRGGRGIKIKRRRKEGGRDIWRVVFLARGVCESQFLVIPKLKRNPTFLKAALIVGYYSLPTKCCFIYSSHTTGIDDSPFR